MLKTGAGWCLWLSVLWASLASANDYIDIVTSHWPPFIDETATTDPARETITAIYAEVDKQVRFHFLPWKRALRDVQLGRYHAIAPIYHSEARESFFHFSKPYDGSELVFVRKRERSQEEIDYAGYIFGVVDGYINSPVFDNRQNVSRVRSKSDRQNLELLKKDRVDACLIDHKVGLYILDQLGESVEDYEFVSPILEYKSFYVAFPRSLIGSKERMQWFNHGLALYLEKNP